MTFNGNPVVLERDALGNPLTSARFIHPNDVKNYELFQQKFEQALFYGTGGKPTYDPDFVFEVNGKKYVMQEEAFPKPDKSQLTRNLEHLANHHRRQITMWTGEKGLQEFDEAVKRQAALEAKLLFSPNQKNAR